MDWTTIANALRLNWNAGMHEALDGWITAAEKKAAEDALEGPWEATPRDDGQWVVRTPDDDQAILVQATKPQAIAVRDALNHLKGDKTDG